MTPAERKRQRGIALLLVLWAFMTLGVLALDFGRYMRDDAKASVNFAEETQAYYAALAAMNKAVYQDELERGNRTPQQAGKTGGNVGAKTGDTAGAATGDDPDRTTGPGISVADGQWYDAEFAGVHAQVRVTDECGRVPLNYASETAAHTRHHQPAARAERHAGDELAPGEGGRGDRRRDPRLA